ncbi:hypothetical protein FHS27_005340 [Rhodopirellula rubra]|uniref:Uncharacterized protein n=1 Tax=Aporhodopirellula rubra TaxID=980271 RepID=A0A7W5H8W2_9BACT|nr:hypothetical protein [Aporhodopirellula rubra]MBB3209500.1 hypothetical protein [Aporhodopirellula rubra]
MKLSFFTTGILFVLLATTGCSDSNSTSIPIDKSELEKYVEENEVPLVGASDFDEVDAEVE